MINDNHQTFCQSPLIGAGEKANYLTTSCDFYLLQSPLLRQRGRLLLAFFYTSALIVMTFFCIWVLRVIPFFCTWVLLVMTFFYIWVLLSSFFYSWDIPPTFFLHISPATTFFTHRPLAFIWPSFTYRPSHLFRLLLHVGLGLSPILTVAKLVSQKPVIL